MLRITAAATGFGTSDGYVGLRSSTHTDPEAPYASPGAGFHPAQLRRRSQGGAFPAVCMFVDISGLSAMTDTLMQHGCAGRLRGTMGHSYYWLSSYKPSWAHKSQVALMEFVNGLTEARLKAEFDYISTEGKAHRRVVWEAMAHLVNHGTQHRSEAAAMLSDMGQSRGDINLIVFLNEGPR